MKSNFRECLLIALLFFTPIALPFAFAQTPLFSEEFDNWDSNPACLRGWTCLSSPACDAGSACYWGRDDSFGAEARPADADCDGWGNYARCQSSRLSFGQFASIITPAIDLQDIPQSQELVLSFCYINSSSQPLDGDGIRIAFSKDGGQQFEVQMLDVATVYNEWTTLYLDIPAEYYTQAFKIRFDGLGDQSTGDIGLDAVKVVDKASLCTARASSIEINQQNTVCKDRIPDPRSLTYDGPAHANYAYILCNGAGVVLASFSENVYDFNELDAGTYRVYGFSYTGEADIVRGKPVSEARASLCHQLSDNYIEVEVVELKGEMFAVTDFNGYPISCFGASDAIVRVQGVGGSEPYSYIWDNAQTTPTVSQLAAGWHSAIITDANGCKSPAAILLEEPPKLSTSLQADHQLCKDSTDGRIIVHAAGGTAPYTYQWSGGLVAADTAAGLLPGTYSVVVTDANGCSTETSAEIRQGSDVELNVQAFDESCYAQADGYALAEVTKGKGPYQFSWSNGATESEVFDLPPGSYQLAVTDALGCVLQREVLIGKADSLHLRVVSQADNGNRTGMARIDASGGTPPYSYLWNTGDTTREISGLDEGQYEVRVEDANGCVAIATVGIEEILKLDCLEIHTGFTPNGDGVNETWFIPCIHAFQQNEVIILNRWGQELLHVQGYDNQWNGTINGKPLPDGTYYYILKLHAPTDKRTFKGTVTIIR